MMQTRRGFLGFMGKFVAGTIAGAMIGSTLVFDPKRLADPLRHLKTAYGFADYTFPIIRQPFPNDILRVQEMPNNYCSVSYRSRVSGDGTVEMTEKELVGQLVDASNKIHKSMREGPVFVIEQRGVDDREMEREEPQKPYHDFLRGWVT